VQKNSSLSLYWKCQLLGWAAASLYWGYMGYIGSNFSYWLALIHFFADMLMYIGLTHLFRNLSRHWSWHTLSPGKLLPRIIPAVIVLGFLFMMVTVGKTYLVRYWFEYGFSESLRVYASNIVLVTTFMTGIRLMSIWLLAYYGYHYAQREIRASRESARLALVAKDAQLNNLAAQLNPHFFFNSLNNIKSLVTADPLAARRAIDLLSELMRTSLYKRDQQLITVQEELALVSDYLELEKIRFEKRLTTHIQVGDQTATALVPPLSIQTLVENAIKHGIAQRKEGGTINIIIRQEQNDTLITVENPGQLHSSAAPGLGLKNLEERLQLQFNGRASFRLMSTTQDTILATLTIPQHG